MKPRVQSFLIAGLLLAILCLNGQRALAQPRDANYDEAQVPAYVLPDPLQQPDGTKVTDATMWRKQRRPEILRLFEEHVFGRSPKPPRQVQFKVTSLDPQALGGKATRKEVTVFLLDNTNGPKMDLLLYLPNAAAKPVPAFLGLNFYGNHCIHPDPGIKLSPQWMRPTKEMGVVNHRATEASRGCQASRWQVEMVLERGYALATVYYGDLEPDFSEGWKMGLRAALSQRGTNTVFQPDEWGAIGAWAWGLSRALDYLEQDPAIAAKQVAVMGHSRLGKTALWAGAQDERFAIVISNNSGEGGASLVRRRFGENIAHSVSMVPYWYCTRYRQYAGNENALPVDAHELIALMAPRPVYVASATKDLWADPRGEFLAAQNAEPVYRLFGLAGLNVNEMPPPDQSVGNFVGYHLRSGDHDVTAYDWTQYLNFADRHFKRDPAHADPSRGERNAGPAGAANSSWKAGVAKMPITPTRSLWLQGFGARTNTSRGTMQALHAKALALEDESGRRAVLVTTDLLGFPAPVARNVCEQAQKKHGLTRDRLLLSSSHTHGGPALAHPHRMLYGARATPEQCRDIEDYTRELEDKVVAVIGAAMNDLRPAQLSFGQSATKFGVNRRQKTDKGYISFVGNTNGPVDHSVPVLRVASESGQLRAVVFGYACHPTALLANVYEFHGDYAGFAQARLETQHPGAVALFVQGCGGDVGTSPRGTVELARQYGEMLAGAVDQTLAASPRRVRGPLKSAFELVPIAFAPAPSREALEAQLQHKDIYHRWQAQELLKQLQAEGRLPDEYPYPLQVWQFGQDLTLVAMAGEVVVDYALRLKKEFGADKLWVAGYCNDVFAYIPSLRVLQEGGYEGGDAMTYYGQPGPFAPKVEETIIGKVHDLVARLEKEK